MTELERDDMAVGARNWPHPAVIPANAGIHLRYHASTRMHVEDRLQPLRRVSRWINFALEHRFTATMSCLSDDESSRGHAP